MRTGAFVITLLLACGMAAASEVSHHPMHFERISLDEGLSQSNVLTILQDSKGLMWFGTENGLNSFDGYEFDHYKRERGNPQALGSSVSVRDQDVLGERLHRDADDVLRRARQVDDRQQNEGHR